LSRFSPRITFVEDVFLGESRRISSSEGPPRSGLSCVRGSVCEDALTPKAAPDELPPCQRLDGVISSHRMGSKITRDEVTKAEAAELLGLSERAVARHAEAGRLTPQYYDRPSGGREVRYARVEVERLREHMTEPRPSTAALTPARPPTDTARQLALLADALRGDGTVEEPVLPAVPLSDRMLLTVAEAAAVTGLGVGYVEKAIAGRMVEARALGRRGARVIRREDLPALVDALWGSRDRS
jgi:hypothetical protein